MNHSRKRAYTIIEVLICLMIPVIVAVAALSIYVVMHFIGKYW